MNLPQLLQVRLDRFCQTIMSVLFDIWSAIDPRAAGKTLIRQHILTVKSDKLGFIRN